MRSETFVCLLVLLVGCGGSAAPGGDGTPTSSAAVDASVPPAPAASSSSSTSAPPAGGTFSGTYEVPVPAPLAAAARYAVPSIGWSVVSGMASLEYDLPLALVGVPVRVKFDGPFDAATGTATLTGTAGTAQCSATATTVVCHETMRGLLPLTVDLGVVQSLATDYAGPAQDRVAVSKLFSTDPIGIASVSLTAPVVDDRGGGKKNGR